MTAARPRGIAGPDDDHPPILTISLDLELRWGVHDRLGADMGAYRRNLENAVPASGRLLALFEERGLRATWAAVGAVGCADWAEYFERAPPPPPYVDRRLAFDPRHAERDPDGALHFAPDLVRSIVKTSGQDLGTQTFSHIYCGEPGVRGTDLVRELEATAALWRDRYDSSLVSLVYPRNQAAFPDVLPSTSIRIWRGAETPWYFNRNERSRLTLTVRVLRTVDSLNPFLRRAAPLQPASTRASLFLRLDLPGSAWRLQLLRIRRELERLERGHVFHLWWHPHNMGSDVERSLARIKEVLEIQAGVAATSGLVSLNMRDLSELESAGSTGNASGFPGGRALHVPA